jgi:hypothetical protein
MMERLLALLLAGALVAPQVGQASALNNDGARQAASKFPEKLPLRPIPYVDTMPWMKFESESKGPGIDSLWLLQRSGGSEKLGVCPQWSLEC